MKKYAVIDIGTTKIKTLIASVSPTGVLVQHYFSNILACFGCEMDKNNGNVKEEYIQRTLDELARVKKVIKEHNVYKYKIVSTHAMRRAKNKEEIKKRIWNELHLKVVDIPQEQEALLFFQAVMKTFHTKKDYAIVDMGGGSVQVLIGNSTTLKQARLMQTGSEYLHTNFTIDCENPHGFTKEEDIEKMRTYILKELVHLEGKENIPIIYGSSNIIDLMKTIHIPLDAHKASSAHPYKTYAQYLQEFMKKVLPLSYAEREKTFQFQKGYMWGVDKAFLNIITIADILKSPYIIPSNANIAQGVIYSMMNE